MNAENFLLIVSVLFSFVSLLKVILEPKKAIRINPYYNIYRNHQIHEEHDFEEVLNRERKYYPIATFVSLIFYSLSLNISNRTINDLFVYIVIGILGFSIFYFKPRKIDNQNSSAMNRNN